MKFYIVDKKESLQRSFRDWKILKLIFSQKKNSQKFSEKGFHGKNNFC